MTEDELIEQLARRLAEIFRQNDAQYGSGDDLTHEGSAALLEGLARECLRQMQWMRRECDRVASAHWGGPASPECGDPNACCVESVRNNMADEPLTLSPPEWTP